MITKIKAKNYIEVNCFCTVCSEPFPIKLKGAGVDEMLDKYEKATFNCTDCGNFCRMKDSISTIDIKYLYRMKDK